MSLLGSREASFPLRFVIVGGSIAGLACAYTLQSAGHEVVVLEKTEAKYEVTGSIRSPPNLTRILKDWGIGDRLSEVSVKNTRHIHLLGETGEQMGAVALHPQITQALGADSLFVPFGELYNLVYELAKNAGATIRLKSRVVNVYPEKAFVIFSTGEVVSGDIVIGADGSCSVIRPHVAGRVSQSTYKRSLLAFTIPSDLFKSDPELMSLAALPQWTMWSGDGCAIIGNPLHDDYACLVVWRSENDTFNEHWNDSCSFEEARMDFNVDAFEPRARKLLSLAKTVTPTKLVLREAFDGLVHESGKVILVGDAARHLTYHGTQNVAMAVEDAVTLGSLFCRLQKPEQISTMLSAFEDIRMPRTAQVSKAELDVFEFVSLPHGPEQRARDDGLRAALAHALTEWDDADEEYLRVTWEEWISMYDYDAVEMVENWWIQWGALMSSSGEVSRPVKISVSSVSNT